MKRRLAIAVILLLVFVAPTLMAAEEVVPQTVGTGQIVFRGFIEAGLYFSVSTLTEESFNLLTTEELLPTGDGVDIGQWTLRVDNPPTTLTNYTIRYEYEPIQNTNEEIDDQISFVILEREETETVRTEKPNNSVTAISVSATDSLSTITRVFSARLTDEGLNTALEAAASADYIAYITVSLETD